MVEGGETLKQDIAQLKLIAAPKELENTLAFSRSNSPSDEHDEQNDDEQTSDAAGSITPTATMAPSWQSTDQDQYQYDEQDCSDSHDFSL